MHPITIHTRRFPSGNFCAITLFPVIFHKNNPITERELRHETVHLWQQAALLVIPFYLLYFIFWIINLIRFKESRRAYREIPFERSAYRLESHTSIRPIVQAFDWLKNLPGSR